MTFNQYSMLGESMQYKEIYKNGYAVSNKPAGSFFIVLYMVHAFYAEVWYTADLSNYIHINSFDNTQELEPWLAAIKLPATFTD